MVVVLGAVLSLVAAGWVRHVQVARTAAQVRTEAAVVRQDLAESFRTYEEVMNGLRGLVLARGGLDRQTLHDYVGDLKLLDRYPGLMAITFGQFVDRAGRPAFEGRLRKEWASQGVAFAVRPPEVHDEAFILAYGEPLAMNRKVLGTDTLGLANNHWSLDEALDTGRMVASRPLQVIQYEGGDPGLLLRLAVNPRGEASASMAERRKASLGCINCVFRVAQLLQDSLGQVTLGRDDIWIEDQGSSHPGPFPAESPLPVFGQAPAAPPRWERLLKPSTPSLQVLDLYGRQWAVHVAMKKPFLGEQEWLQPLGVACLGGMATLLFAGLLRAETRVGQRSHLLASRMTRQLQEVGEELKRSQAHFAAVIESTTDLIWSVDRDFRLLTFNAALSDHLFQNYHRRPEVGGSLADCLPPERARLWAHLYEQVLKDGAFQIEYPLWNDQIMDLALHPIIQNDAVVGVAVFGKDITERKKAEEFLRASEEKYRKIVDRAPMGIFRRDLAGTFVASSPGLWKQFECDSAEAFAREYPDAARRWSRPEVHEAFVARLLKDGQVEGYVNKARLKSGAFRWHMLFAYLDKGDPRYFDGFSIDVTQLKLAEAERIKIKEQLHQSQKMDAIGQMAGGIAHDFNNMLMGIIGAAELLANEDADLTPDRRAKYLNMILTAADRAGELTRKLLASSRKDESPFGPVDARQVVKDTLSLLERTLDKRITVTLEDRAEGAWVLGNASMLANVFMNMGINAGHAMPEGGTLAITLQQVHLDEASCAGSSFELEPGPFLEVEVRDNGCGMDETVRTRVFEPFFTTKVTGQGTGLGLAMAYGAIQDHRGAIHVYSEPGVGTAFHVYLPLSSYLGAEAEPQAQVMPGTGTILVVDDEEMIRVMTHAMLTQLGYTVLTAANGEEALARFRDTHSALSLVILDMIMPVMSGRQAFELMRAVDPGVPVLLSSGFSKEEDLAEMTRSGLAGFLRKPYRVNELSSAVAQVLRQP